MKSPQIESGQAFRATINNFKTLVNMFDKHNMKSFEPKNKKAAEYEKQYMNMDYLNYLNEYNKE